MINSYSYINVFKKSVEQTEIKMITEHIEITGRDDQMNNFITHFFAIRMVIEMRTATVICFLSRYSEGYLPIN